MRPRADFPSACTHFACFPDLVLTDAEVRSLRVELENCDFVPCRATRSGLYVKQDGNGLLTGDVIVGIDDVSLENGTNGDAVLCLFGALLREGAWIHVVSNTEVREFETKADVKKLKKQSSKKSDPPDVKLKRGKASSSSTGDIADLNSPRESETQQLKENTAVQTKSPRQKNETKTFGKWVVKSSSSSHNIEEVGEEKEEVKRSTTDGAPVREKNSKPWRKKKK